MECDVCALERINDNLRRIVHLLRALNQKGATTMATLADLQAAVAADAAVDTSAIALIQGLAAQIQTLINAGADPAALQALVDSINASSGELAAAVAANTPAQP